MGWLPKNGPRLRWVREVRGFPAYPDLLPGGTVYLTNRPPPGLGAKCTLALLWHFGDFGLHGFEPPPPSARNAELVASLHTWGRRAHCHAARSARCARYRSRPSLRATSRLIVDTARHSRPAMTRSDSPPATPRKISSRSCGDRCRTDRFQGAGRTPPASSNNCRIDDPFLPSRRAIDRVGSPARRSHTSAISASVNLFDTPHLLTRHHNSRQGVAFTP